MMEKIYMVLGTAALGLFVLAQHNGWSFGGQSSNASGKSGGSSGYYGRTYHK